MELYALARLDEARKAAVEEHLLFCGDCRANLDESAAFALAMRRAIRMEAAEPKTGAWRHHLGSFFRIHRLALAGGLAGAAILALVASQSAGNRVLPLVSLQLTAIRGDATTVPQARAFDVTLTDAPSEAGLRVDVVGAMGARLQNGPLNQNHTFRVTGPQTEGPLFLRLFDSRGKLLHEYAINVSSQSSLGR